MKETDYLLSVYNDRYCSITCTHRYIIHKGDNRELVHVTNDVYSLMIWLDLNNFSVPKNLDPPEYDIFVDIPLYEKT